MYLIKHKNGGWTTRLSEADVVEFNKRTGARVPEIHCYFRFNPRGLLVATSQHLRHGDFHGLDALVLYAAQQGEGE